MDAHQFDQEIQEEKPDKIEVIAVKKKEVVQNQTPKSRKRRIHGVIRPRRYRSGVVAGRQVKFYQKTTALLIPRKRFWRLCREILQQFGINYLFSRQAIEAIQESSEAFIVELFQKALKCTAFAKRQTMMARDIKLAQNIIWNEEEKIFHQSITSID